LQALNTVAVKMLTVEDPIEYNIDGIMQVPVNLAAGLTFDRAMRTFLRHDPDIVMVGEIRDHATAHMAMQASLTGHFVLSTLHERCPRRLDALSGNGHRAFFVSLYFGRRPCAATGPANLSGLSNGFCSLRR
jgi:type IV pilus assembly protein PilB